MRSYYISGMILMTLLLAPCPGLSSQTPVDSSRVVRILTYNILHGETLLEDFDLDLSLIHI